MPARTQGDFFSFHILRKKRFIKLYEFNCCHFSSHLHWTGGCWPFYPGLLFDEQLHSSLSSICTHIFYSRPRRQASKPTKEMYVISISIYAKRPKRPFLSSIRCEQFHSMVNLIAIALPYFNQIKLMILLPKQWPFSAWFLLSQIAISRFAWNRK